MAVLIVAFIAVFGGIAAAALAARSNGSPSRRVMRLRAELTAYEDAIAPAVEEAGRAIVAGIRPDLADFDAGRISSAVWVNDLNARIGDFQRARDEIGKVPAPPIVGDAPAWFNEAFDQYVAAAKLLLEAASVSGAERSRVLDLGAALGDAADRLFDRAAARIQAARRRLGLPPTARLSDKRFGDEAG